MSDGRTPLKMRKLIIAGTYAQYRDWLVKHNANPRAALYIAGEACLRGLDPELVEIVLTGDYSDNPAYQSAAYWDLLNRKPLERTGT